MCHAYCGKNPEIFPSRCGILAEAISIASTFLQQRQSISLTSFLQCPHLHQLRFPILICSKSAAEAEICLVSFSWFSLTHVFFLLSLKLKQLKDGGVKVFIVACIFFRIITFFIKIEICYRIFSISFTGSKINET